MEGGAQVGLVDEAGGVEAARDAQAHAVQHHTRLQARAGKRGRMQEIP
jgi:hypothetical protein